MYDNNQAAFRDCCNAVRLGSEWGEEFGALNKRRVMPKNKTSRVDPAVHVALRQ